MVSEVVHLVSVHDATSFDTLLERGSLLMIDVAAIISPTGGAVQCKKKKKTGIHTSYYQLPGL